MAAACLIFTAACIGIDWDPGIYACDPAFLKGHTCINVTLNVHSLDLRRVPTVTRLEGGQNITALQVSTKQWCETEWAKTVFYFLPTGEAGRCLTAPRGRTEATTSQGTTTLDMLQTNASLGRSQHVTTAEATASRGTTLDMLQTNASLGRNQYGTTKEATASRGTTLDMLHTNASLGRNQYGITTEATASRGTTLDNASLGRSQFKKLENNTGTYIAPHQRTEGLPDLASAGLGLVGTILGGVGLGLFTFTCSAVLVWRCRKDGHCGHHFKILHQRAHHHQASSYFSSRRRLFSPSSASSSFQLHNISSPGVPSIVSTPICASVTPSGSNPSQVLTLVSDDRPPSQVLSPASEATPQHDSIPVSEGTPPHESTLLSEGSLSSVPQGSPSRHTPVSDDRLPSQVLSPVSEGTPPHDSPPASEGTPPHDSTLVSEGSLSSVSQGSPSRHTPSDEQSVGFPFAAASVRLPPLSPRITRSATGSLPTKINRYIEEA